MRGRRNWRRARWSRARHWPVSTRLPARSSRMHARRRCSPPRKRLPQRYPMLLPSLRCWRPQASRRARAAASDRGRHLRRALEADRFGIVAHVLATRDGCTPGRCSAFAWLQDTSRIGVNLAERPFEARIKSHQANWPAAGARPGGEQPALRPGVPGIRRGGEDTQQPLLPVVVVNSACQHHDGRTVAVAATPRHDRRDRYRDAGAAQAVAGRCAGASAVELEQRAGALGADAARSPAIDQPSLRISPARAWQRASGSL